MADLPGKAPPPVPAKPVAIKSDRFRHSMYASTPPTGEDHALGQQSHTMELTSKPKPMPRPKPRHLLSSNEDRPRGQGEHVSPTKPALPKQEPGSHIRSGMERHSMYASVLPAGEQVLGRQKSHTMELAGNKPGAISPKPKPMPRPKPAQPLPASGEDSLRGQDERVSTFPMPTRSERVPASSMKHVAAVPKSQFKSHADIHTKHGGVAYFNGTAPKMAGKQAVSPGERRGSKQPLASTMAFANKFYDQWKESRGLQKKISGAVSIVRGELFPHAHGHTEHQEGLLPQFLLKEDHKDDFISTCRATLQRLHQFDRYINRPSSGSWGFKALETLQQLEDRKVLISVFGRFNSGKSTLLNALLATRFLPERSKAETSVKVNIKHADHVHCEPCPMLQTSTSKISGERQDCENCPYLEVSKPGDDCQSQTIRGAEAIKTKLEQTNKAARGNIKTVATDRYTLFASIPIIKEPPGTDWKIYLVDNPGFGDANKGVSDLATTAVTSSSSYVYIMNYKQLGDEEDTKAFKLMAAKDKDVFKDRRVIIAVTHFDSYYTADEDEGKINKSTIKMNVLSQIGAAIDTRESLPESMVIPVCGQWARFARQLKYHTTDQAKQMVVECLRHYNEYPRGQAENLDTLPSDTLAGWLENASGLLELESRIQQMAQSCSKIWVRTLHGDCERFIQCASGDLNKEMKTIDEFVEEKSQENQENLRTYTELTKCHNELQRTMTGKSSEVYQSLDKKYPDDMEGLLEEGKSAALKELEGFRKEMNEKLEKSRYPAEQWYKDLDEFLQKTSMKLEKIYGTARFDAISGAYADALEKMGIIAGTLKTTAGKFCQSGPVESEIPRNREEGKPNLLERIKANPPNWNDIKDNVQKVESLLSRWTSLWLKLKKALGIKISESEENCLSKSNLSKSFSELEKLIKKGCSGYAKDIRPTVVEYFYDDCKRRTQEILTDYEQTLQTDVDTQKEAVDKIEEAIEVQQRNRQVLDDWYRHLLAMKAYLDQKKDDFLLTL